MLPSFWFRLGRLRNEGLAQIAERAAGAAAIWVARHRGQPVAGIVVLRGPNDHYMRGAMDKDLAGPTRANFLLHWLAIQDACQRGVLWYQMGLVVTSVPKVPFWKACYFNKLCLRLPDNILICLEIQLFPFGDAIQEGCIDKCLPKRSQDRATPEPVLVRERRVIMYVDTTAQKHGRETKKAESWDISICYDARRAVSY
jgi:hypothetical protein